MTTSVISSRCGWPFAKADTSPRMRLMICSEVARPQERSRFSRADETAAWTLVQKGLSAPEASRREKLYLAAVATLYKDAGAGAKSGRDQNYRDAMAEAYAQYPDDETTLFYGLSILGAIPEGSHGFAQLITAKLCESHPFARNRASPTL